MFHNFSKIYGFTIICLLLLGFGSASASTATPKERVEIASAKVMELLLHEDFQNPATKESIIKQLEEEVVSLFDFDEFSSRTVGPKWKQFTPAQKKDFIAAFTELLRSSYINTLDNYDGQSLVYVGEIRSSDQKKVEVHTLYKSEDKDYPVSFRMLLKNDNWYVYDVSIEGISMIKNYREQFRSILGTSKPEELIKRVKEKALEKKKELISN